MTKLNADQLKKLRQIVPLFTKPILNLRLRYEPTEENIRFTQQQLGKLVVVLKEHDWLIIQALEAYAELDAELMTAQDTIAELEEALNEANGIAKVDERERIRINPYLDLNLGAELFAE